jgi:hypothetical protein
MKQLGLGMLQYSQDNDEAMFPVNVSVPEGGPGPGYYGEGWAGPAYPYLKSVGVLQCPDDSHPIDSGYVRLSYAYNNGLGSGALANQVAPATTVLFFEDSYAGTAKNEASLTNLTAGTEGSQYSNPQSLAGQGGNCNNAATIDTLRHDKDGLSNNYTACDGHVKFLHVTAVSSQYNPANPPTYTSGGPNTEVGQNSLSPFVMSFNPSP